MILLISPVKWVRRNGSCKQQTVTAWSPAIAKPSARLHRCYYWLQNLAGKVESSGFSSAVKDRSPRLVRRLAMSHVANWTIKVVNELAVVRQVLR